MTDPKFSCECDEDMGCPSCCESCEAATGGQCREHWEPECTCYEATYGHQPGCYFNRVPAADGSKTGI